jgi:hypothetical protein
VVSATNAAVDTVNVADTPPMVNVVVVAVLNAALVVSRTQTLWPFTTLPTIFVNVAVQPIEYSPLAPEMLIGAGALMPPTVTAADAAVEFTAAPPTDVNAKLSGVVSATKASVVALKTAETPPIVRVAEDTVLKIVLLINRTQTLCPSTTVPATLVNVPVHPIEYSPLLVLAILIGDGTLIPETTTATEETVAFKAAPGTGAKLNPSGVESGPDAPVVAVKVAETPPIVRIALAGVVLLLAVITRTHTDSPFKMVPAALVNALVHPME